MKLLQLNLKAIYFDAINNKTKCEEYRLCNDYWKKRLINQYYDKIILKSGYPKKTQLEKHLERPYLGYEIKTITHPHFGDKPVEVFAIKVNPIK